MSVDKIFDLTAGVYFNFYGVIYYKYQQRSLANMSHDLKFVELTADVLEIF